MPQQSLPAPLRLHLPKRAVRRLQDAGIYCRTDVRLEHQHLAKRYVIHGTESGGAIRDIGRYVTFCGPEGEPIEQLHPVDSLGPNGAHAVVVAPVLIKVDMFRYGRTYQLLISRHEPSRGANGTQPTLKNAEIFRGTNGYLPLDLCGKDKHLAGTAMPDFFSRAGEKSGIPPQFHAVVTTAVLAASCMRCIHAHYLLAPAPPPPPPAFASHH
ncbi:MAG: hypothetical protein L0387_21975 [Acidobacteria bacterium]|nr:hypothetical protein [Acidobacteriota bacterium]MCI0723076.1 hypothetical protein [Acidobacteriota bacterium]